MATMNTGTQPPVSPWAKANPIIQGMGVLTDIYGTYKGAEMAEKNYELALKEFEDQKKRMEEMDVQAKEQLKLKNMMTGAQYAQDMGNNMMDRYGSYARSIGR